MLANFCGLCPLFHIISSSFRLGVVLQPGLRKRSADEPGAAAAPSADDAGTSADEIVPQTNEEAEGGVEAQGEANGEGHAAGEIWC